MDLQVNRITNHTVEEIHSLKSGSLSPKFHYLKLEPTLTIVSPDENKSASLSNTTLSNSVSSTLIDLDNTQLSTAKESSSPKSNHHHVKCDSESLTNGNYSLSETKLSPCDPDGDDEDDIDLEDRPLTVVTQETDDVSLVDSTKNNSQYE
ncbi:hypothetical protein MN116_002394 [Schistosoma mekongi]|uniref:Uncharacterized protein n=1 Tax=Schistosoma mekongi TaxID=38744 RepID=A0AAE2D8D2_SCHME|nr:hypothetical protein MN116_002394 [Schistosoma mekongi]